jgi:glycerophosphoryl diester phosphodiesterase
VLEALRAHDLVGRTLVSSMYRQSLARLRAAEPDLRLGWSVPRVRRDYTTDALTRVPALAVALGYRSLLPGRARAALQAGECDALMAHWRLVTRRLIDAVLGAGGELYVWTVDDAALIGRLESLGVTGIITNDPRLFSGSFPPATSSDSGSRTSPGRLSG